MNCYVNSFFQNRHTFGDPRAGETMQEGLFEIIVGGLPEPWVEPKTTRTNMYADHLEGRLDPKIPALVGSFPP